MKAAVLTAYGPPQTVQLQELPDPEPGPGQLRVRVHAATVTAGDGEIRRSDLPWLFRLPIRLWLGWFRPRSGTVPGMELAGIVDAVGPDVDGFAPGDRVVAGTEMGVGACAELAVVGADGLVATVPDGVDLSDVAPLPIGGLEAVGYLRRGGLAAGKRVLVRGASGSIGTYAVQLARRAGATVVAVCGPDGVEQVAALGADEVLDYTTDDVFSGPRTWDLVLDVVGRVPLRRCLALVEPGGTYVRATVPGVWEALQALFIRLFSRKRVVMGAGGGGAADLRTLVSLVADGQLRTVFHGRFPLSDIARAHAAVDAGHKQGHVLVEVVAQDTEGPDTVPS